MQHHEQKFDRVESGIFEGLIPTGNSFSFNTHERLVLKKYLPEIIRQNYISMLCKVTNLYSSIFNLLFTIKRH